MIMSKSIRTFSISGLVSTSYRLYIIYGQSLFDGNATYGALFTLLAASSEIQREDGKKKTHTH